jgi:hypothetical protein
MKVNRKYIVVALMILLLAGLLWSRALLSISTGLWVIFFLLNPNEWGKLILKNNLLIWCFAPLLLFFMGTWQDPSNEKNYQLLLTFCAYPVAALAATYFDKLLLAKKIIPIWIVTALIALLFPIGWFLLYSKEAIIGYGSGKSLPVFMDNDHLRFGIFLCSALLLSLTLNIKTKTNKIVFLILATSILFLAVRTAWIMAFIIVIGYLLNSFITISTPNKKQLIWKTLGGISVVLMLVFSIPTAKQKIAYTIFDWQQYNSQQYDNSYSDGVRRAINNVSWKMINQKKIESIGWAAIPSTLQTNFSEQYNGSSTQFGWPFNQWLFWWIGAGWWGTILFTIWLFYPAYIGWKQKNIFLITWTIAIAASCLVECTLNYQYGVFLHVWPIVFCWKLFSSPNYERNL